MTTLLKKGQFGWTEEAEEAFKNLKQALTTTPTLTLANFEKQFVIETDTSSDSIGVVLTQKGQPIAYMSHDLIVVKQAWSTYVKEMLTIVVATKFWSPYLMGRKFFIHTD